MLDVQASWKGHIPPKVRVRMSDDEHGVRLGDLASPFQLDSTVLVFAVSMEDGEYFTSVCRPSVRLSAAMDWLRLLGKPRWRATD